MFNQVFIEPRISRKYILYQLIKLISHNVFYRKPVYTKPVLNPSQFSETSGAKYFWAIFE